MPPPTEPVDIAQRLTDPKTIEDTILRIFAKRSERGLAFSEAACGVSYFGAATDRRALATAIACSVASGEYQPQPVDLWFLETKGKRARPICRYSSTISSVQRCSGSCPTMPAATASPAYIRTCPV